MANIRETLSDFKTWMDAELEVYFDQAIAEARKHDVFIADGLEYAKRFALAGGKRLRGALFFHGYLAGGGTDRENALRAAMSVELVHLFLLVHDDIMDRDHLRHGIPTIHAHYEAVGRTLFPRTDAGHFGTSMALILGDMLGAFGNQILFTSPFPPDRVVRALERLQGIVSFTVIGQSQDFLIEHRREATEQDVLSMYENKTARYTVHGPLFLGYILSGADDPGFERMLDAYALPIGIAFQIQDDILGIFGSQEKIGKPVASDIVEGKMTLLVTRALEKANGPTAKRLRFLLKRGTNITGRDVEEFRSILIGTGAVDYARDLARRSIEQGKSAVLAYPSLPDEARGFLLGLADYMAAREF